MCESLSVKIFAVDVEIYSALVVAVPSLLSYRFLVFRYPRGGGQFPSSSYETRVMDSIRCTLRVCLCRKVEGLSSSLFS